MAKASKRVDKAQNQLIKSLDKRVNNLEASIEKKYNWVGASRLVNGPSLDLTTTGGRQAQIETIEIAPIQGLSDAAQRVGDKVNLTSIQLRYSLSIRNAALKAKPFNRVRVLMFWDTAPNFINAGGGLSTSYPEWPLVLQSLDAAAGQNFETAMLSTKTHDLKKRFQIIYDKVHCLTSNGLAGATNGQGSRSCVGEEKFFKSYKKKIIRYNAGGPVNVSRRLHIAYLSDNDSALYEPPVLNYFVKVQYEDM